MSEYKNPDKMSVVELRRVAKRAINVLRSSGYGGWDLQDAYARLRKELEVEDNPAPYGYCPNCGARGVSRERRPDGNDRCESGCEYPSRDAVPDADPTPWCHVCGAKEKAQCDCGPIAEND